MEAGGHVQATSYLKDVLPTIIEIAGEIPVLVSGGISTDHDVRNAIHNGAAGAVMGSRFIDTKESGIHTHYKQRLVDAKKIALYIQIASVILMDGMQCIEC